MKIYVLCALGCFALIAPSLVAQTNGATSAPIPEGEIEGEIGGNRGGNRGT